MKKVIVSILFMTLFLMWPKEVFAVGGVSVSPNSLSMEVGDSKTFTITATNTIGDGTISSSDSSVATVSNSSWETGQIGSDQTVTRTITVAGVAAGTATITITVDAATFDEEPVTASQTIQVTVNKKQGPLPYEVVKPQPKTEEKPTQQTQTSGKNETKKEEPKKSSNNKLKEISIVGYDLIKIDDNNYRLSVDDDVSTIIIKAIAEDEKATITGNGEHNIQVGENEIEVIIKAEDGSQNKININVLRKEEVIEEEPIEEEITTGEEPKSEEKSINVIAIAMIALNVILAISVISLIIKNNKLKKMNN